MSPVDLCPRSKFEDDEIFVRENLDKVVEEKKTTQQRMIKSLSKEQESFTQTDLKEVLREMIRDKKESEKTYSPAVVHVPPETLAQEFLESRYNGTHLRFYKGTFFTFTGTHFEEFPKTDLRSQVTRWLRSKDDVDNITSRKVSDIITNIEGAAFVPSWVKPPVWIATNFDPANSFISLKNGVVNVDELLEDKTPEVLAHTPNFFIFTSLPYEYQPEAECSTWMKFLKEALPQKEVRDLLQEWFGLQLVYDTTFEKFVLVYGQGGNGKSVATTVLKELIGHGNFSSVSLENFDPNRTFPLAGTEGKLANIVSEMGEIHKAAEGILKQYVSGESITVERKHKDPFPLTPTARLTLSTNVLPRFIDRSDGLWRRLLLIRFASQILDEKDQDQRLINPTWWRNSGELSGIFNWAIEGLRRLYKRGHFLEPSICLEDKEEFKKESNPARTFLAENCEFSEDDSTPTDRLYAEYKTFIEKAGQRPMSQPVFSKEVTREFPSVQRTKNALRQPDGSRARVWQGLKLLTDTDVGPPHPAEAFYSLTH